MAERLGMAEALPLAAVLLRLRHQRPGDAIEAAMRRELLELARRDLAALAEGRARSLDGLSSAGERIAREAVLEVGDVDDDALWAAIEPRVAAFARQVAQDGL